MYFITFISDDANQIPLCGGGAGRGGEGSFTEQIEGMLMIDLQHLVHLIRNRDQCRTILKVEIQSLCSKKGRRILAPLGDC